MKLHPSLLLALMTGAIQSHACGPFFPNSLLDNGGMASLIAPRASFDDEIKRLKLVPSKYPTQLTTNSYSMDTAEADIADLKEALESTHSLSNELLAAYQQVRSNLVVFAEEDSPGKTMPVIWEAQEKRTKHVLRPVAVPSGIPPEFSDYLFGAIAWAQKDTNAAIASWEKVMKRPEAERRYRSTWAAFMLGRALVDSEPERALKYFRQVRELADKGFSDRLGLAFSSIGWEARAQLNKERFLDSIHLYLKQADRDPSAVNSLKFAAAKAIESDDLIPLASDPEVQPVITVYLASRAWNSTDWSIWSNNESASKTASSVVEVTPDSDQDQDQNNPTSSESEKTHKKSPPDRWLEAVEEAGIRDMESAERLALIAYQIGEPELAQRWIDRSRQTLTSQWLQAKLYLCQGKLNEAASIMKTLVNAFPSDPNACKLLRPSLTKNLRIPQTDSMTSPESVGKQITGEFGAIQLARGDYTMALDALLKAHFWTDSAYVAERVLSLDELKEYVDKNWPALSKGEKDPWEYRTEEQIQKEDDVFSARWGNCSPRNQIRALLGRRLVRSSRGNEALPYFDSTLREHLQVFLDNLNKGWNLELSNEERGKAFFAAAKESRENGLKLIATEVEPDWAIWGADYDYGGPMVNERAKHLNDKKLPLVSAYEIQNAKKHAVDPEKRFHYRYVAADLAWAAAVLLPDGSEETAKALCLGGSWLKYRDPQEADRFYKALVRRCGNTKMGQLADDIRWFPSIDKDGNLSPDSEQPSSRASHSQKTLETEEVPLPVSPESLAPIEEVPLPVPAETEVSAEETPDSQ